MHGPPVVSWLVVALSAVTAAYCLLRMRSGSPETRRVARGEAVMGVGMAVMAVPASVLDPQPYGPPLFAVVFGAAAVRSAILVRQSTLHVHHAVADASMVYMALAMGLGGASHSGHAMHAAHEPSGLPLLTGALLGYFACYALWTGSKLLPAAAAAGPATPAVVRLPSTRPELAAACRVSMCLGMFAMLLTL